MSSFWQFFDSQMAIFRRVRFTYVVYQLNTCTSSQLINHHDRNKRETNNGLLRVERDYLFREMLSEIQLQLIQMQFFVSIKVFFTDLVLLPFVNGRPVVVLFVHLSGRSD